MATLRKKRGQRKVSVFFDRETFESALPNVSARMIVLMVAADMGGEEPGHVSAQLTVLAWPKCEVEMVGHQAEGQQPHRDMLLRLVQELDEGLEITVLVKDGAPAIPTVKDMVTVSAQSNSKGSCHALDYDRCQSDRQPKSTLTPFLSAPSCSLQPARQVNATVRRQSGEVR